MNPLLAVVALSETARNVSGRSDGFGRQLFLPFQGLQTFPGKSKMRLDEAGGFEGGDRRLAVSHPQMCHAQSMVRPGSPKTGWLCREELLQGLDRRVELAPSEKPAGAQVVETMVPPRATVADP